MSRVDDLIARLGLKPHPEGGWFAEIFRSDVTLHPEGDRGVRSALTTIYFLLARGQRSRLHRVLSDEVWHFYEGDALRLTTCEGGFGNPEHTALGPLGEMSRPVRVVPAGFWQAAEPMGEYALVGCTVGPGFEFADFAMLADDPVASATFRRMHPGLSDLV